MKIGSLEIGGGAPIIIQSMTNTQTTDVDATLDQIQALRGVGCQLVRLAVPNMAAAEAFAAIKKRVPLPIVADIHFDHRLALAAIHGGADKIRINPGNIPKGMDEVAREAILHKIPIRIGVNGGSLSDDILKQHGHTPRGLVESARNHINILNDFGFDDIIVSLKSSSVPMTVAAYRLFAKEYDYPLHLGVTETGGLLAGSIKSAMGIGALLMDGIGDTIRVTLTADPVEEIPVAKQILRAAGLYRGGVEVISCPTCGRCQVDLIRMANEVEEAVKDIENPLKVAVMGCSVNGPGEAREADIGICGGDGCGILFKKGKPIRKVPQDNIVTELMKEIRLVNK